jgi:formylglycine-generating enzyme required for sulfatase activity
MARIEKTVFISYRRTDVYTALAVYENLKNQGYDVFFDYRSISSGDFEQIITSNIKARAHFLLILTPTALDRCNEPGDWLRREIETAIDEKRNIIPLFFNGFQFGDPSVTQKLTGKLKNLSRYNGLNVHEDYFDEAMHRLPVQYLNIPLDTVLHPVSTEVQRVVRAEQVAADQALEQIEDVRELVRHPEDMPTVKPDLPKPVTMEEIRSDPVSQGPAPGRPWMLITVLVGGLVLLGVAALWGSFGGSRDVPTPTATVSGPTFTPAIISPSQPETTSTPEWIETVQSPAPAPSLGVGSTLVSDLDSMTLLYVPAGEFIMGNDNGALDEQPAHRVYLDAFWIDQSEVTNHMYSLCVDAKECQLPKDLRSFTRNHYYGNTGFDNYPVIQVDWNMAQKYCTWAGRRLPTEAEWEKAARGMDGNIYPWGNDAPNATLLNYNYNAQDTTGVNSYAAGMSPYGAYDMLGNVWEWVSDWYDPMYYQSSPPSNPKGPATESARVHRGGSWRDDVSYISAAKRDSGDPAYADFYLGFRCAMDATQ